MAKRWIGDAKVRVVYTGRHSDDGRDIYRGYVAVRDGRRDVVWSFDNMQTGVGGISDRKGGKLAADSPEAYDEMAETAVTFGASLSNDESGNPKHEVRAAVIEEATGCVLLENGRYEVRRKLA